MNKLRGIVPGIFLLLLSAAVSAQPDRVSLENARRLAQEYLIVDTHIDLPYRLLMNWEDVSVRTSTGDFDYSRAKEGGLDVPFMSIYTPASLEGTGKSRSTADTLIDIVCGLVARWPDKFALVVSPADILRQSGSGKILLAMGMENGSPLEGSLGNLRYFYSRGIRYITLAHGKSNHICDSSYDPEHHWNGLSPFGRRVVEEMNRLGIMIDVSHASDSTFQQVIRLSKAPVIASHSACRYFTPGFERNMDDGMIRQLAANGGVIQINFGSTFINNEIRQESDRETKEIDEHLRRNHLKPGGTEARTYTEQYHHDHPVRHADVADVVMHIDHVVKLVGVDFVGLGSDFDGVGDSLPIGLKDVSQYPNLIFELLKRGYSDEQIRKICGGNLLRVWSGVEQVAAQKGRP